MKCLCIFCYRAPKVVFVTGFCALIIVPCDAPFNCIYYFSNLLQLYFTDIMQMKYAAAYNLR